MEDFMHLNELLTDEERMIQETVARWVDDSVLPVIADAFDQGYFPPEFMTELGQLGVLGMTLPAEYGCAGSSYIAYGIACQELERGDSGLRSFMSVQSSLCMYPIFAFGSDQQKQRFLPQMAQGKLIGCFGLTEPDAGSDPASMQTTAKSVDGGWLLNGSKMWITNASIADLAIVWAQTTEGVRGFIVEKEFPGFQRNKILQKMSMRASDTGELVLSDCFVPHDNYLPGSDCGLKAPLSCLSQARYGIAWGTMGAAIACFDMALSYVKERKQFSKPVASFQLIQKELAAMFTEITKTQCFNYQLGRLKNANRATPAMISMAKMNAAKGALNIARTCRNLIGANGISLEYHVIRHMLNLESVFTYEGTDNVHHLVLGKHLTGINAFA